jgi:LacI family transcriptional regulator
MALGAYAAISEAGLSIPGDIAVVGYDDDALGPAAAPALTTMHQSMTELGAAMAEKLVRLIEGQPVEHATILKTRLIVRSSS